LGVEALELTKSLVKDPGIKWVRKMLDDVKAVSIDGPKPTAEDIQALKQIRI
jgi:hypothetical protein